MDINKIIILFLLIVVGYIARKVKFIDSDIKGHISKLVLNVTLPLFIFGAMQFEFSKDVLKETGILVIISFVFYAVVTLISYLYVNGFKIKEAKRDVFQYVIIFSNVGYMGYPIMNEIAGKTGLFYAAIYNLSFNILTWTLGVYIMTRHENKDKKISIKERLMHVINPSLIAVIFGFTCFIFSIKLPVVLIDTFDSVGGVTTPLSMMFIGIILSEIRLKDIISDFSVFGVVAMRLLITPILVYFTLRFLGFEEMVLIIPTVLSAMPAAANTAIVASRYNNDYQLASKLIFITTLLSIVTIPLILSMIGY